MNEWILDEWMDKWMDRWKNKCIDEWIDERMVECMKILEGVSKWISWYKETQSILQRLSDEKKNQLYKLSHTCNYTSSHNSFEVLDQFHVI